MQSQNAPYPHVASKFGAKVNCEETGDDTSTPLAKAEKQFLQ